MSLKPKSWARLVSDVLSPPAVWGVIAFPIALREAETVGQALVWALVYIVLVCALPALYIGWLVMRGEVTDIHLQVREQRIRPMLVSIACTALAWLALRAVGAPPLMPLLALVGVIQLAIILAITFFWQISMHTMSITCAVMALAIVYGGWVGLLLSPLIPVVGAARIHLKRHTLAQVVAGGLVGGGVTALTLIVVRPV